MKINEWEKVHKKCLIGTIIFSHSWLFSVNCLPVDAAYKGSTEILLSVQLVVGPLEGSRVRSYPKKWLFLARGARLWATIVWRVNEEMTRERVPNWTCLYCSLVSGPIGRVMGKVMQHELNCCTICRWSSVVFCGHWGTLGYLKCSKVDLPRQGFSSQKRWFSTCDGNN